jgi:drug/metabolite transporter (DMT)-like permease
MTMKRSVGSAQAERTGTLLILVEDLLWGLFPTFTHLLVSGRDPLLVAGISSLAAGIPFLLYLLIRHGRAAIPARALWLRLGLVALFGQVFSSLCFFLGTAETSALNATLLSQVEPLYSMLLASLFLKEAIGRRQLLATLLLVMGACSVLLDGSFTLNRGDLLVLFTPLWYQVAHLLAKRLFGELATPLTIPAVRLSLGGLVLLVVAESRMPGLQVVAIPALEMLKLVAFGLGFIGLEKLLWYEALRRLELARATALLVPSVGIGVLGAVVLGKEAPRVGHAVGLLAMLLGLWLLTRAHRSGSPVVEEPGGLE